MEKPNSRNLGWLLGEGHERRYEETAGQNYESSPVHD